MAEDEDSCQGLDEKLAACDYSPEEIKCMGLTEKQDLVQALLLSIAPSISPVPEKVATPQQTPVSEMEELQQRLKNTGVSMSASTVAVDDPDEITVLKEVASPYRTSLRRPPIRSVGSDEKRQIGPDEKRQIVNISPLRKLAPSSGDNVRARKKDMLEPANKQTATPVLPEADEQEVMPVNEYVKRKAEIYALNPFNCVDTALSTLAKNLSIPKRKRTSVPFFSSEHALSLKLEDYVELCCRKFGCSKPPSTCVDVEETCDDDKEVLKNAETSNLFEEQLDFPTLSFEESTSKYNLRQRSGNKRAAGEFEFTSDGEDSDSIIPNKKNRDEKDATFSLREEAKAPIPKTRVNKLSLATAKIASQQAPKPNNELVIEDSDESNDSEVPGKEVCVPKLQYSAVVGKDTASIWKTSKNKVSAKPKNLTDSLDSMEAMSKTKQMRAKSTEVIKPGPVSGKTRRVALGEGSNTRRPGRGKQANKKESDENEQKNPEKETDSVACPVCTVRFPNHEIETHVNACCDESASKSTEGQCPVCLKHFPQDELEDHSSVCIEKCQSLAMDED